ncbi:MAG TPA: ergothioneine biosynthesis protein EgtB [Geobacteraceae bacterium]
MREKRQRLLDRFVRVQDTFDALCAPLTPEEHRIQPITEASPPWWSVMHTGWFYARNILRELGDYGELDRRYDTLLNSYYHALGPYLEQGIRGRLSEPANDRAYAYRASVRGRMERLIATIGDKEIDRLAFLLEIGANHEEQHMELLLTEVKRIEAEMPFAELRRPYRAALPGAPAENPGKAAFIPFAGGEYQFGNLEGGWCWDNELAVHRHHLRDFALMNRLVTNGDYLEFIGDGGYADCRLWLSTAYDAFVKKGVVRSPLYWENRDGEWWHWTLAGMRRVDPVEPVCHVNFYEAHAFALWKSRTDARFRGVRLPTEREWEHAARSSGAAVGGNLMESGRYHPAATAEPSPGALAQMVGDVWVWTLNHYEPYPGYTPLPGGLAEYNAKFMNNQRVLRGGSCATPRGHMRLSYRNFWPPLTQFQFTGIRLAMDLGSEGA